MCDLWTKDERLQSEVWSAPLQKKFELTPHPPHALPFARKLWGFFSAFLPSPVGKVWRYPGKKKKRVWRPFEHETLEWKKEGKRKTKKEKNIDWQFWVFCSHETWTRKVRNIQQKGARQQLGTFRVCFVSHFSEFLFSFSYAFFPSGSKFTCLFFLPPPSPPCHIIPRQFSVGGSFLDKAVLPPFLGRRM